MITDYDTEAAARAVPDSDLQIITERGKPTIYRVRTADDRTLTPAPNVLPARQFWIACLELGYLPSIKAMKNGLSESEALHLDKATDIDRNNPVFKAFAAQLGVTSKQIDDLFVYGAGLT